MAAVPLIRANVNAISRSECASNKEFWHSLGREFKAMTNLSVKHLLFYNRLPNFEDSFILAITKNDFIVTLMESFLINKDHPTLYNNKQSLSLQIFDNWLTASHQIMRRKIDLVVAHLFLYCFIIWVLYIEEFNFLTCGFIKFHLIVAKFKIKSQHLKFSLW